MSALSSAQQILNKTSNELTDVDLILTLLPDNSIQNSPSTLNNLELLLKFLFDIDNIYQFLLKAHKKPPMFYYETSKDLGTFLQKSVELSANIPKESEDFLLKQLANLVSLNLPRDSLKDQRIKGFYEFIDEFLWKLKAKKLKDYINEAMTLYEGGSYDDNTLEKIKEIPDLLSEGKRKAYDQDVLYQELMKIQQKADFLQKSKNLISMQEIEGFIKEAGSLGFNENFSMIRQLNKSLEWTGLLRGYNKEEILKGFKGNKIELGESLLKGFEENRQKKPDFDVIIELLRGEEQKIIALDDQTQNKNLPEDSEKIEEVKENPEKNEEIIENKEKIEKIETIEKIDENIKKMESPSKNDENLENLKKSEIDEENNNEKINKNEKIEKIDEKPLNSEKTTNFTEKTEKSTDFIEKTVFINNNSIDPFLTTSLEEDKTYPQEKENENDVLLKTPQKFHNSISNYNQISSGLDTLSKFEADFQVYKLRNQLKPEFFAIKSQLLSLENELKSMISTLFQEIPFYKASIYKEILVFYLEFEIGAFLYGNKRGLSEWKEFQKTFNKSKDFFDNNEGILKDLRFYEEFQKKLKRSEELQKSYDEIILKEKVLASNNSILEQLLKTQSFLTKIQKESHFPNDLKLKFQELLEFQAEMQNINIDFSKEIAHMQRSLSQGNLLKAEFNEKSNEKSKKITFKEAKELYAKFLKNVIYLKDELDFMEKELIFYDEIKEILKDKNIEIIKNPSNFQICLTEETEEKTKEVLENEQNLKIITENKKIAENQGIFIDDKDIDPPELPPPNPYKKPPNYENFLHIIERFESFNFPNNRSMKPLKSTIKLQIFIIKIEFMKLAVQTQNPNFLRISYKTLQKELENGYSLLKTPEIAQKLMSSLNFIEKKLFEAEKRFMEAMKCRKLEEIDAFDLLINNFLDISEEILQYKAALAYDPNTANINFRSNNLKISNRMLDNNGFFEIKEMLKSRKKALNEENKEIFRERTKSIELLKQILIKFQMNSEGNLLFFAKKIEEIVFEACHFSVRGGIYQTKFKKLCEILMFMSSGLKKVAKEFRRRGFDKESILRLCELDDLKNIADIIVGHYIKPGKKRGRKPKNREGEIMAKKENLNKILEKKEKIKKKRGRKPKNFYTMMAKNMEKNLIENAEKNAKDIKNQEINKETNNLDKIERNERKMESIIKNQNNENCIRDIEKMFDFEIPKVNSEQKKEKTVTFDTNLERDKKMNDFEVNLEKLLNWEKNSLIKKKQEKSVKFNKNPFKRLRRFKDELDEDYDDEDEEEFKEYKSIPQNIKKKPLTRSILKQKRKTLEKPEITTGKIRKLSEKSEKRLDFGKNENFDKNHQFNDKTIKNTKNTKNNSIFKKPLINTANPQSKNDLNTLFKIESIKPKNTIVKSPKRLESLLGKQTNYEENILNSPKIDKIKKHVIQIISSDSSSNNYEKPAIPPILFDPDEEPKNNVNPIQEFEEPMENDNESNHNEILINMRKNPFIIKEIQEIGDSPEIFQKNEEITGNLEEIQEPSNALQSVSNNFISEIFSGHFKFNKSHSKTSIRLLTSESSIDNLHKIPQFSYKNPKKPKLLTSGTTNISNFIRFYFELKNSNKRLMISGWVEALDEVSQKNIEALAEELTQTEQITGLKFGMKNSASIHFFSLKQLEYNEHLRNYKKTLKIYEKEKKFPLVMLFLITINADLLEKKEKLTDITKIEKNSNWKFLLDLEKKTEIEKEVQMGIKKLEEEEMKFKKEIEDILDEEVMDLNEVEDDQEKVEILNIFKRKKAKF